ncbi:MAG: tRNA dimethylallyltransferase [Thermotoga sp. 50_1627]|uniref:tRNA (adenosine(37)-N6)-dimethylallyltransferase MiaA n=1 Tax=Pseudothermotoga sp. TaxID=2033661 RepID=UPI00076DAE0A|nr:MAG: tRNA dimethylallyltransferase [Thermotoga sp. 50_64]KUK25044.1 MAG: tRNA dimethylallyltransferase [Thermotoga sp. 50_1627]MBC7116392.1 tRNA (adenosine(37)-N6)-dimethylallyltransferase MiaA [Pseudothermotoga sp.]MDK2923496.1 tRNA dimethylallyltransferase [Pseudothermotoga sp.]HBT39821.1 tRNA (adenosine(37)-N6)-dimethylallyltransferase MiaA [Pseudothermotoga sp.]
MIVLTGPTGVGKTEIAIELAARVNAEIISVDSRQIYKFMDIGTAKPTTEQRKIVPHHLIDIVYPDEYYSVYNFRNDALKTISQIRAKGKIPLLVGGTGLYIDALTKGIFEGAPRNEQLRQELLEREAKEPGRLRRMLEKIDPEAASRIHVNDLKRTIRALEVWFQTGCTISQLQRASKPSGNFTIVVLTRDRRELYDRINVRVERMIEEGLVEEVKSLLKMGYSKDLNALRTIGYREIIEYLEGKESFERTVEKIKRNTRHFARRQFIWFRRYREAAWLNATDERLPEKLTEMVSKDAQKNL